MNMDLDYTGKNEFPLFFYDKNTVVGGACHSHFIHGQVFNTVF